MLSKFLPFERKYLSVGVVWRHNARQEATRATVFSSRPHTMRDAMIPLLVPLKAATKPLQARLEKALGGRRAMTLKGSIWLTRGGVNRQLPIFTFLYQIKLCIKVCCLDMQLGEQPI